MMDDNDSIAEYEEAYGLLENYFREQEWLAEISEPLFTRESVWTTRDGKRIAIKDMEDSHLVNTIRVLKGESPIGTRFNTDPVTRRQLLNVMCNEAYRRGLEP